MNVWMKLTRPDDKTIWFALNQIVSLEPCTGTQNPEANTAINTTDGGCRYVKETCDEVVRSAMKEQLTEVK